MVFVHFDIASKSLFDILSVFSMVISSINVEKSCSCFGVFFKESSVSSIEFSKIGFIFTKVSVFAL